MELNHSAPSELFYAHGFTVRCPGHFPFLFVCLGKESNLAPIWVSYYTAIHLAGVPYPELSTVRYPFRHKTIFRLNGYLLPSRLYGNRCQLLPQLADEI